MIISHLSKKHYRQYGGTKYFIDCSLIPTNEPISIIPEAVLKNENDISIIRAIFSYSKHIKKNKKIVIKIAHKSRTNQKEYDISKKLKTIPCFIQYICIFNCFDTTYSYIKKNEKVPQYICTADNIGDNDQYVLISSNIELGSIKNYKWTITNTNILKSLLKQSLIGLMYAYINHGFLHNDLHLDNILIKRTKKEVITYNKEIDVKTDNYKPVIMDFDLSFIDVDRKQGLEYYWNNLYNLFSRLQTDLNDKIIPIDNYDKLLHILRNNLMNKKVVCLIEHRNILLELIDKISFKEAVPLINPVYNPLRI